MSDSLLQTVDGRVSPRARRNTPFSLRRIVLGRRTGTMHPMARGFVQFGAASAGIAVALGAFGAHALREELDPRLFEAFETAVRYQMYHALALFFVAWLMGRAPGLAVRTAGWAFIVGIVIFSGSLYALSLTGISWLGAVTPFGGAAFLLGWGAMLWGMSGGDGSAVRG